GARSRHARAAPPGRESALAPPRSFNLRNLFEMFCDGVLSTMEGVMGKKNAVKYMPFIGSLAFFIFFCNALALLPRFSPPTDPLQTHLALSLLLIFGTHYVRALLTRLH